MNVLSECGVEIWLTVHNDRLHFLSCGHCKNMWCRWGSVVGPFFRRLALSCILFSIHHSVPFHQKYLSYIRVKMMSALTKSLIRLTFIILLLRILKKTNKQTETKFACVFKKKKIKERTHQHFHSWMMTFFLIFYLFILWQEISNLNMLTKITMETIVFFSLALSFF